MDGFDFHYPSRIWWNQEKEKNVHDATDQDDDDGGTHDFDLPRLEASHHEGEERGRECPQILKAVFEYF